MGSTSRSARSRRSWYGINESLRIVSCAHFSGPVGMAAGCMAPLCPRQSAKVGPADCTLDTGAGGAGGGHEYSLDRCHHGPGAKGASNRQLSCPERVTRSRHRAGPSCFLASDGLTRPAPATVIAQARSDEPRDSGQKPESGVQVRWDTAGRGSLWAAAWLRKRGRLLAPCRMLCTAVEFGKSIPLHLPLRYFLLFVLSLHVRSVSSSPSGRSNKATSTPIGST